MTRLRDARIRVFPGGGVIPNFKAIVLVRIGIRHSICLTLILALVLVRYVGEIRR